MNKKKLVTGLLSTAIIGGVLVTTALPADAATYGEKSTGSITFKKGTIVTPPVTPPVNPPVIPPNSDFALIYVPKEFNFQETAVPTSPVTGDTTVPIDPNWEGSPAAPTLTPTGSNPTTKHVLVGDVRGKRAAGWKLEAKMTAELSTGSKNLTGAKITMGQTLNSMDPVTWTATPAAATVHTPDTVTSAVTLNTATTTIMKASAETSPGAADGRGEGYWQGEFTNINLVIPDTAMNLVVADEQYSGTIDWTLTDSI